MKILIIDDGLERCRKIEEACKTMEWEIETIVLHDLSSAIAYLEKYKVDAIVTDRSYPLKERETESADAGHKLLEWLSEHKKEIPVLGNSTMKFVSNYPFYKGKMNGYLDMCIFYNFISSIRNRN